MNADPRVMEFFPSVRTRAETEAQVARLREHFDRHGYGYWALEIAGVAPFIGFVGLKITQFEAPFAPCVDIGWRLAFEHWGRGYVTEGARAALEFGFHELRLNEIVSFTVPANLRSRRVMERLGMIHSSAEDFDKVPEGHALRRHVLYRLSRDKWRASPAVPGADL
jgi:RimJ/RimL family protein N-acetyltransferase